MVEFPLTNQNQFVYVDGIFLEPHSETGRYTY